MPKLLSLFIAPRSVVGLLLILLGYGWMPAHAGSGSTTAGEYRAAQRLQAWQTLLAELPDTPELQKLQQVNRFFNAHIRYAEDAELWNVSDHWAPLKETLELGAGDCEDFALAKYFTLLRLGFAEEKLRLLYTTLGQNGQAHMVLAYWPTLGSDVMILDNLNPDVTPLAQRTDLHIQFVFDSTYVYKYEHGSLQAVGTADLLPHWRVLLDIAESTQLSSVRLVVASAVLSK